ncbi:hypothetical protein ACFLR5_00830 [Elusimicrobiota bacterium]
MKLGLVIQLVVALGLLIYSAKLIKQYIPSSETLTNQLEKFKDLKSQIPEDALSDENYDSLKQMLSNTVDKDWQSQIPEDALSDENYDSLKQMLSDTVDSELDDNTILQETLQGETKHSPVVKFLLEKFSEKKTAQKTIDNKTEQFYTKYIDFINIHVRFGGYYLLLALILIGSGILLDHSHTISIAMPVSQLGYIIGNITLITASLALIIFRFLADYNLLMDTGINLFLGPAEVMVGALAILKVYDPKFPVYNKALYSLVFPLISSIIIFLS